MDGTTTASGAVTLQVTRGTPPRPTTVRTILGDCLPRPGLPTGVARYRLRNIRNVWRGLWRWTLAQLLTIPTHVGVLRLVVHRGTGEVIDFGVVSCRVVTTAGVGFIVDAFQNLTELENLKFHGFGTGGTAEAVGDTALVTELTTQYVPDNTRPTGTTTEGASANIYRTVATLDPDADVAITEHGIFSQAATGGGVLLDRSLFAVINLSGAGGDTLQATYELTVSAGG